MQQIGKYTIIKRLGKGGMGIVYKALNPVIDKVVALKLLQPSEVMAITLDHNQLEEIFLSEAKTVAGLHHRNIAGIWDLDRDQQDRPFFVMDYYCNNLGAMIGESFRLEEPSRLIRPEKVIHYGLQIIEALDYLHHNEIIHRDIKPHNILITDNDTVKVGDFGMALVGGVSFSGPDNMQIGSPFYTPPEQKKAPGEVDGRADCYSCSVLLYRMLTGTLPGMQSFPLSRINARYDSSWDDFFHIGLSWDPARRYQSAAQMKQALQSLRLREGRYEPEAGGTNLSGQPARLRTTPENKCGKRARAYFRLTGQDRPQTYITSNFKRCGELILDRSTCLLWQHSGSPYPLSWQQAHGYIARLNRDREDHIDNWRLPTVDELMSLLDSRNFGQDERFFDTCKKWFWSCDQHGRNERWLANLDMGFAAVQDMDCLNHVRAVSGPIKP